MDIKGKRDVGRDCSTMGIDRLPILSSSKKIKYVFSAVIILLTCVIIVVFVRNRMFLKHIAPPLPPEKTKATLSIQNFRHMATQDGQRKWSIEASSANLYSDEKIAKLSNISAIFFINDDKTISLTADKGVLHVDTNNMIVSGHIVVKFSDYIMTTEHLNYVHKSHIINATTPVMITGDTMTLKANTMIYNIDTDILKCSGDVEGTFQQISEK
jgi:LPS export ABC transporter protein LptC